jgi:hypothetical protein
MLENFENIEQPRPVPLPPESSEFLRNLEQAGKDREIPKLDHVGLDKAAQDFERALAHKAKDLESRVHMHAGIPLPEKAQSEEEKARLIDELISRGNGDPYDEINMLTKN